MSEATGQASCDIHNFGHYLVKILDSSVLYWDRLNRLFPDYDLLNDHNINYFVNLEDKSLKNQIDDNVYGRKLCVRGKTVILVYNDKLDEELINPNPFSVAINMESDSIHSLLINYNAFKKLINNRDYNGVYTFFATFFTWLYGSESPQSILHALITYIDVMYNNLKVDKVKTFLDYNLSESTDIISQVVMSKFNIKDPHGFTLAVLDLLETKSYTKVFYYPSYTSLILKEGGNDAFLLKGFIALIADALANQTSENKKLVDAIVDFKDVIENEGDSVDHHSKDIFKSILEFEPRLEKQIDLLFAMGELSTPIIRVIYDNTVKFIDTYGINNDIVAETEEEAKQRLEADIEARVQEAIRMHNGGVGM